MKKILFLTTCMLISVLLHAQPAPALLPFNEDFEGTESSQWTIINGYQPNKWFIGSAVYTGTGGKSAYISDDISGATHNYNGEYHSITHMYRDITFPTRNEFSLSFDWMVNGENTADYLQVALIDTNIIPIAGMQLTSEFLFPSLNRKINWKSATIFLPDTLSGKTKRLVFTWVNTPLANQPPAAIDNIKIDGRNCVSPQNLRITDITSSTIDIAWLATGSSFNVNYRIVGTSTWIQETSTVSNYTIGNTTPLTPNTEYEIRVQKNCGTELSLWTSVLQCKTSCIDTEVPFLENFDNSATGSYIEPNAPLCWQMIMDNANAYEYIHNYGAYSASNCYQMYNGSNFSTNDKLGLISPPFSNKPLDSIRICFFAKAFSEHAILKIGYFARPEDTSSFIVKDTVRILSYDTWKYYKTSFEGVNFSGNRAQIGIMHGQTDEQSIFLDNILIETLPLCPDIDSLKSTNVTSSTISLLASSNNVTDFTIAYREINGNENSWIIENSDTSIYTIINLNPNTLYEIKAQSRCTGSTGSWSDSIQVRTSCSDVLLPIFENFDNTPEGSFYAPNAPLCWSFVRENQSSMGYVYNFPYNSYSSPNLYYLDNSVSPVTDKLGLISPSFSEMLNIVRARFMAKGSSADCNLVVGYLSSPPNISSFIPVDTVYLTNTESMTKYVVNFDTVSFSNRTAIAFLHGNSSAYQSIYLDDVAIEYIPNCADIDNLAVTGVTTNSINITFDCPTENSFGIEYREVENADENSWIQLITANTNYTITGLTSNTEYEIRVQSRCVNGSGTWSETIPAITSQIPARIPFVEDFEGVGISEWRIVNGNQTNRWVIDTAVHYGIGIKTAYISNDFGQTNSYTLDDASIVHLYRDITFDTNSEYRISFNWKGNGNFSDNYFSDYLRISLTDVSSTPVAGTLLSEEDTLVTGLVLNPVWNKKEIILLPFGLQGETKRLVFTWVNDAYNGTQPPVAIDSIQVRSFSCGSPYNIIKQEITSNSIKLSWSSIGGISYNIQYKKADDINWQSVTTTDTFYVFGNTVPLSPNTEYEFRMQTVCGTSNVSQWSEIKTCKTPCLGLLPMHEDFETTSILSPAAPSCWSYIQTSGGGISADEGTVFHSGLKSYLMYGYYNATNNQPLLVSPYFSDLSVLRIKFFAYSESTGSIVTLGVMTNPQNELTFQPIVAINVQEAWTEYTINLDTVSNISVSHYLAISACNEGTYNKFYIDDIIIETIPLCRDISGLNLSGIDTTSATLRWDILPDITYYELQYKHIDSTTWINIDTATIALDSCRITGLSQATNYHLRARTHCNASDSGNWTTSYLEFQTLCPPAFSLPYAESFSQSTFPPNCWNIYSGLLDEAGTPVEFSQEPTSNFGWAHRPFGNVTDAPMAARIDIYSTTYGWLITPPINFGNTGNTMLEFDLALNFFNTTNPPMLGSPDDKFMVLVSTNNDWTIHDTVAVWSNSRSSTRKFDSISGSGTGEHISIHLTNVTGIARIAFYGVSTEADVDNDLFIGNIKVTDLSCHSVSDVVVETTGTSATVTWDAMENQSEWEVKCMNGTTVLARELVTTTSITFDNLQRGTTYTVSVRAICNSNDTSNEVISDSFTINRCDTVSNITPVKLCSTTAVLTWTALNGQTQWQLCYKSTDEPNWHNRTVSATRDTLTNLSSNSTYELQIRTICGQGDTGVYTEPITFQTNLCDSVQNIVTSRNDSRDSVFVSWLNNECHQNWQISVVPKDLPVDPDNTITTNTYQGTNVKLSNPSLSYDIYVRGSCGNELYSLWNKTTTLDIRHAKTPFVKVTLAPNPAHESTKLSIEGVTGNIEMAIMTADGKILSIEKFVCQTGFKKEISLKGLAKGTYLIRLTHKDFTKVERLIVQ